MKTVKLDKKKITKRSTLLQIFVYITSGSECQLLPVVGIFISFRAADNFPASVTVETILLIKQIKPY